MLCQSEVRNVRVTGAPIIPAELELSASQGLNAWLAEYYGETVGGDQAGWEKRGEEIFGRKLTEAPEGVRQSLLQYHRPMFEDGQIDYEFFYQAGEATVAPAVDRLALLIEASGVDIHWLTDAQYDRTGLPADNRTTEKENRRGPATLPLKDHEWNQARLTVQGDTVTLLLNGVEIYRRQLEPTNQRMFGFYHDASQTEARVRNVRYRGDWPKSLPALDQQELAVSPTVRATLDPKKSAARFEFDFRGKQPLPSQLRTSGNAEKYTRRSAEGARITLPADEEKPAGVGFETTFGLRGDFEIVAVYSGLKIKIDPKAWGPGVDLHARLDAPENADLELERRQREDSLHILQSLYGFDLPGKLDRPMTLLAGPLTATAGKLKIVRKGPIVYYLFAEHDSDDYQLFDEHPASEVDAANAGVYARAFSKASASEVVIEKMSVRAESFPNLKSP
jgi:hypothetical protein